MLPRIRSSYALGALALALAGCSMDGEILSPNAPFASESERTPFLLDDQFAEAASAHDVPVEVLKALSYAETRFEMIAGEMELEGMAPASGLMALRGEVLEHGAELAGVSVEAASEQPLANMLAAAALLSEQADALAIDRADLAAWAPAIAAISGIENAEARAHFIHDEVYEIMRQGVVAFTPEGEIAVTLDPIEVEADYAQPASLKAAGPDYASSIWRPSPNYNSRPSGSGGDPAMVVIHTCEGSYAGCWGWLTNSASGVSAHYVVKENGSEISQLVREAHRAWHVGASYQCSNNNNVDCWRNGSSSNNFTIGIEHAGYASQASFPSGQIDASARLVCDITSDHDIPRDRYHIVAHGALQPYNRVDPGPNWPWTTYLNLVNSYCGGGGGGSSEIIVDSNNGNNDTAKGYIEVSSNWTSSANVGGYYGTGYWWASAAAVSDGANFWFYLPSAASKTVDAWWTAASDRSTGAPFIMYDSSGNNLGAVYTNQQTAGGRWNTLGTFNFKAGWNRVYLSRWTGASGVVIPDAVRIR